MTESKLVEKVEEPICVLGLANSSDLREDVRGQEGYVCKIYEKTTKVTGFMPGAECSQCKYRLP